MFDKLRRKLAKLIAPKPKKRVKKQKYTYDPFFDKYTSAKEFIKDKSYQQFKRNKQATVVGIE